jgi:DNA-binding XRE family transcriptional regulator
MSPKSILAAILDKQPELKKLPQGQLKLVKAAIQEAIALSSHDTLAAQETDLFFKGHVPDSGKPSAALRAYRKRMSWTQYDLAKKSGIPQPHISAMEAGKRPIGSLIAKRLALALGVGYKKFL